MSAALASPSLTVALALAAGVLSLVVARHLRAPSIVVLLAVGILLGPDVAGLVRPDTLGAALPVIIELAVAVILFEGGLNLQLRRLRREAPAIRRLVSIGAVVTALGGTVAARAIMGWDWATAYLFGTLVIVTGPTVIIPLLRRIRARRDVETVLEAEGILIDPIGAIIALVSLQVVLSPSPVLMGGILDGLMRLGFGLVMGTIGGLAIAGLLRARWLIPEGLENIVTLGILIGLTVTSNTLLPETGVMTATMAGLVVGNIHTRVRRQLREFKEQLTLLFIGLLFVLLAAAVRLEGVLALGWPGVITVLALMLVVRPLCVAISTAGLRMPWRQRVFLSWVAPRGIVAAAVASHFAHAMHEHGREGGAELLALVFLVIAMTVNIQGLTGGLVAQLLRQSRSKPSGICFYGANSLARAVAKQFVMTGRDVVLIESRSDYTHQAEEACLPVVYGNGLEERTLLRARIDTMSTCVGMTDNEEANFLFGRRVREEFKVSDVWVALQTGAGNVSEKMVDAIGAHVLFSGERDVERWHVRLDRGLARLETWERTGPEQQPAVADDAPDTPDAPSTPDTSATASTGEATNAKPLPPDRQPAFDDAILPLLSRRGDRLHLVDARTRFRSGDRLTLVLFIEKEERGAAWLAEHGWRRVGGGEGDTEATRSKQPVARC
jgi:NhaP-type Na+/H+ or K+/H+ antiporter